MENNKYIENKMDGLISRTLNKFRKSYLRKLDLLKFIETHKTKVGISDKKLKTIKKCGQKIQFNIDKNTGEEKLSFTKFCKCDRICISCATRRSIHMIQRFVWGIKYYGLEKKNRYFFTLTVKHGKGDSLDAVLQKIFKAKKQLSQNRRNSNRKGTKKKNFFSNFDGIAMSIEVKPSSYGNGRHPHLHCLGCSDNDIQIDMGKYRQWDGKESETNEDLLADWLKITGDSYIHNIRKIDVANQYNRNGLGEVFKYALKMSSLSIQQQTRVLYEQQRKGYRFFSTHGIFLGWDADWKKHKKDNTFMSTNIVSKFFALDEELGDYEEVNQNTT